MKHDTIKPLIGLEDDWYDATAPIETEPPQEDPPPMWFDMLVVLLITIPIMFLVGSMLSK